MEDSSRQDDLFPISQPAQKEKDIITDMIRIWKNEKLSPVLLPYEEKIIADLTVQIETKEKESLNMEKELRDMVELDNERVKFMIKDYLRIRLAKIEKFMFYILKNDLSNLLSQNEIKFIVDLVNMKSLYFNEGLKKVNVLCNNFRPFLDRAKDMSSKISFLSEEMIVSPDENEFESYTFCATIILVFIICLFIAILKRIFNAYPCSKKKKIQNCSCKECQIRELREKRRTKRKNKKSKFD